MDEGTFAVLVSVLTLIAVAFFIWKRKEPITLESVIRATEDAVPIAQELAKVAETGVGAAEQLFVTGRLTRDERLNYALNYVKGWSPALANLENEKIFAAIEAAVLAVNALRAQAGTLAKTQTGLPLQ